MKTLLASALLLAQSAAPQAPDAPATSPEALDLSAEQSASLRCGVAFGIVAGGQEAGDERALAFPPMEPRGKEFFVRTLARLMDEKNLTREQVFALAMGQMAELGDGGIESVTEMMPACLMMLDASGL